MGDIWSFLLQTLTASGAAALLLCVKAMFRDKLSPRWQFAAWGILGLVLLVPAGRGGRYVLANWPFYVEALRTALTGEYGTLARVAVPVPLPPASAPASAADWVFLAYWAGVVVLAVRYLVSYIRLRLALRRGKPASEGPLRAAAERYGLPVCPAVEVEGLSSAFVCGVWKPVLALPADGETDEKVLLHELLHHGYHDAAWGLVLCFFRCVHWCNPLIWFCADQAGNDLEALCDQRVLERLEGEDRRDYGRILLDMADERYARTPGTSSMANGSRNIRRRIEAIARFKRYPRGMELVSVCVALVLAAPLLVGQRAGAADSHPALLGSLDADMAAARTTYCTTYAGAFDAYAKAVLREYIPYRAMCAPLAEQDALAAAYRREAAEGTWGWADAGLPECADSSQGYYIYNLTQAGEDAWEGLLTVQLMNPPGRPRTESDHYAWLAVQQLRAEKEGDRWVVIPLEDFWAVEATGWSQMPTLNCEELPSWLYEAAAGDFKLQVRRQSVAFVDSYEQNSSWFGSTQNFSTTPQPSGKFTCRYGETVYAIYTGSPEERGKYTHIAAVSVPLWEGDERPALRNPGGGDGGGGSTGGDSWGSHTLPDSWDGDTVFLSGGGASYDEARGLPDSYAIDLYLNYELAAQVDLPSSEGGLSFDGA